MTNVGNIRIYLDAADPWTARVGSDACYLGINAAQYSWGDAFGEVPRGAADRFVIAGELQTVRDFCDNLSPDSTLESGIVSYIKDKIVAVFVSLNADTEAAASDDANSFWATAMDEITSGRWRGNLSTAVKETVSFAGEVAGDAAGAAGSAAGVGVLAFFKSFLGTPFGIVATLAGLAFVAYTIKGRR